MPGDGADPQPAQRLGPRARVALAIHAIVGLALCAGDTSVLARAGEEPSFSADSHSDWWEEGDGRVLPEYVAYPNRAGMVGLYNKAGVTETRGHPFFEPIGSNGRACVTCHQPANGMSVSVDSIQERWEKTQGKDPIFAAIDGSNCPSLPQEQRASHSLLLERGLFRIALPWPPKARDGSAIEPDFELEVVRDPTGCNTDARYGIRASGEVSVFRRPRPFANLKYVIGTERTDGTVAPIDRVFTPKGTATPFAVHPQTGLPVTMQIMADARHLTLQSQVEDAAIKHLQAREPVDRALVQKIVDFGMQLHAAQAFDHRIGSFLAEGMPEALGPYSLARNRPNVLGDNWDNPVFFDFDKWRVPAPGDTPEQTAFRQSVARGYDLFFLRPFYIRDAMHINTTGIGNPSKRACATCHNMRSTGMDLGTGWVDLGTTNLPWAKEPVQSEWNPNKPELPLFKITCKEDRPQHLFLGRVIYTQDPGRALITGKCYDVGAIVMQQFRALSARAPYFSNGSARTLRELVDFYDRRFNIGYSEQERTDLANFLSVL